MELMSGVNPYNLMLAVAAVGLGLVLLVVVLWLLRRRSGPSPFLRGGKNRQPRLQVLDAAAVDARRRIVLVRRDDVEHLVMIGGPTDVVIESGIRPLAEQQALRAPQALDEPSDPRLEATSRQPMIAAPPRQLASQRAEPAPQSAATARPEPAKPQEEVRAAPRALNTGVASEAQADRAERVSDRDRARAAPSAKAASEPAVPVMATAGVAAAASPASAPVAGGTAPAGLDAASDALDAARRRVFQPTPEREPVLAPEPARPPSAAAANPQPLSAPSVPASTAAKPVPPASPAERPLGSAFDRILEEEMANGLAAGPDDRANPPAPGTPPMTARRDPAMARVTGATPDPSLQTEIARIFGEMSVTRDNR
ncbi:flagellar biogenesis protein FliO [Neorhizobium galegae]|uniref:flagellar biosynthetic protein FliO n=1 Tax=Neorhizobium galegae TaxID=399 RepID=UPI001AE0EC4D|nr:flagellar biosynthetic protein FliO [Neorhizobium galegae]MBP2549374.1 flagellar biogenesis protein FliO [Neorhizobium galegae]